MVIDSCTNWECVNSFANWLSAFGTILISSLALWLSVKDRMVNISAKLTLGLLPNGNPYELNQKVYVISFTNIGFRSVTVTNHCWQIPFVKGILFLMPYMDNRLGVFCSKMPLELTDGKEGHIFYADNFFNILDEPEKALFHKNRLIAWLKIQFFKVYICTTIGKRIKVKVARPVRQRLWSLYKESNSKGET